MTTILLVDDHQIVRQGVRSILEVIPNLQIVGGAVDGLNAVRIIERLQPDIAVVDLMMPGLKGIEVVKQAQKSSPRTRAIVFSMYADEPYVLEALRYGAWGYVLKSAPIAALVKAVQEVIAGRHYLSPPLSELEVEAYLESHPSAELDPYEILTRREREVLQLAAEGRTSPEIASRLFISSRTVEVHRANLMRKLDLHNQTDLVRYALHRGLLPMT